MIDLSTLTTERRNNETFNLDQMTVAEALIKMNNEDKKLLLQLKKHFQILNQLFHQRLKLLTKVAV